MTMQMPLHSTPVPRRQRPLLPRRLLLRGRRTTRTNTARNQPSLHAAIRRRVIVGERIRGALAGGEEGRRGAVILVRRGIDAEIAVLGGQIARDALVEELDVAACDGGAADGAGDGHGVGVHVADVDGARAVAEAGFDEAIGAGEGFPYGDAPGPAAGEGVAGRGGDRGRFGVAVWLWAAVVGAEGEGEGRSVGVGDADGEAAVGAAVGVFA